MTMKFISFLFLTLPFQTSHSLTFESAAATNTHQCTNQQQAQNETSSDGVDSCLYYYYNEALNVDNVFEVDLDVDEIAKIRADYERDVRPYLQTGKSTDDFCLTTPYDANRKVWSSGQRNDGKQRSDMKWYSPKNEATFQRYMEHVDRLGLRDLVKGRFVDANDDDVSVYNILYLVRSHSETHHWHLDWSEELGTQSLTFLVPLNNFSIHMKYYDNDDEIRPYKYKYGKGVGFGGGFMHSTDIGHGDEEDVLLCVYLGGNDPDLWEYVLDNMGDEAGYYNDALKRAFVKNENVAEDQDICL